MNRFWKLARNVWAHPSLQELVAARDGELEAAGADRVERHLRTCARCRRKAARLDWSLGCAGVALREALLSPPVEQGIERLLIVLRDRQQVEAAELRARKERNLRLAVELSPYFGRYPGALLESESGRDAAFEVAAERLAETFLGKKNAAALVERVDTDTGVA